MNGAQIRYALVFGLGLATVLVAQSLSAYFATCHQAFNLLNPIRRCEEGLSQGEWDYEELRDVLSDEKAKLKASKDLTHLSVYFQDLTNGPRFGIGEYDKFQPASLMKLPVLIFFLHTADLDPTILDRQLSFTGDLEVVNNVEKPEQTIEPDMPYTIRELLEKMIVYSDNRSYDVLLHEMHVVSEDVAYYTFRDLDVLQMMLESDKTYVSISSYAKLYGVLYNMAYLSKEMSQYALQLLSQTSFREGIVAGVQSNVPVAHKFGFAIIDGERQLHDCGIVYHPNMAYILCVMTSGPDENKENAAISNISRIVYDTVSSRGKFPQTGSGVDLP